MSRPRNILAEIPALEQVTESTITTALGFVPVSPADLASELNFYWTKSGAFTLFGDLSVGGPVNLSFGDSSGGGVGVLDLLTFDATTIVFATAKISADHMQEPLESTGTAIAFDVTRTYGYTTPETGNVTLNSAGLKEGVTQLLIHNNGTEPTFGAEFKVISGAYTISVDNYIMLHAVKSDLILVTISQEL